MRTPSVSTLLVAVLAGLVAGGCASTDVPTGELDPEDVARIKQADDDARSLFGRATEYRAAEEWSDARKAFQAVYQEYPSSDLAPEAQFQAAECAYGDERYWAAGNAFAKYIEDRPLSPHVDVVEKRMYDIGNYLIEDGKNGLWGTGWFQTSDEGVQVLRRLATLLPTGTYADDALMRIGRYYLETRDYDGAELSLDELLKNYPDSEWRLEARFVLAWTYRLDNRGPSYDGEKLRRARAHFLAWIEQASSSPDSAAEYRERLDWAREEVAAIEADLASKALLRADLWERMDKPRAARVVLEEAARLWGSTEPGQEAAARLAAYGAAE